MAKNAIIFGTDISLSAYWWSGKDVLILGEGRKQGLDDSTLTVDVKYSVDFT